MFRKISIFCISCGLSTLFFLLINIDILGAQQQQQRAEQHPVLDRDIRQTQPMKRDSDPGSEIARNEAFQVDTSTLRISSVPQIIKTDRSAGLESCAANSHTHCDSTSSVPLSLWYERQGPQPSQQAKSVSVGTTCTVTTTADSGSGTLRQCLLDAAPGTTIDFDLLIFPPTAPATITLFSAFDYVATDMLTIDGSNAGVILTGAQISQGAGFVIDGATGVTVRGLQILDFPWDGIALIRGANNTVIGGDYTVGNAPSGQGNLLGRNGRAGVWIEKSTSHSNQVLGNFIGTDVTGERAMGNGELGVGIAEGATDNVIGGELPQYRNLISDHQLFGVMIRGVGTTRNRVQGNLIGTNRNGTIVLGNQGIGVILGNGANNNLIGGSSPGAGNLISGNLEVGIQLEDQSTINNVIAGNYIGTDLSGMAALGNGEDGILVRFGASQNTIGGDTPGARNLISGNQDSGIQIQNTDTISNQVLGNYIGVNVDGAGPVSNLGNGVTILSAPCNIIGGDTEAVRNLISGNGASGIHVQDSGAEGNQIQGNYIGLDATGAISVSNGANGISIVSAGGTLVGGDNAAQRNIISGNQGSGIILQGDSASRNQIQGNYIGIDNTGMKVLSNGEAGIGIIVGANNNLIGGAKESMRNIISGNGISGIDIEGAGTTANKIQGNYIGTNVTGDAALGNSHHGVLISNNANANLIGGSGGATRNLISGNKVAGVWIQNVGTMNNQVTANYIGIDKSGATALPNTMVGVFIGHGATQNTIGGNTPELRNLISGNGRHGVWLQNADVIAASDGGSGVWLQDEGTMDNKIIGNYIGTDSSGTRALPNALDGVTLVAAPSGNFIGSDSSGAGNLISGNQRVGIWMEETGTTANVVAGNIIGANRDGKVALANQSHGIFIGFRASANTIGGDTPGARNIISGNGDAGIYLFDSGTSDNRIVGNYIGVDITGKQALGNKEQGIVIVNGPSQNKIGADDNEDERNIISGNGRAGVWLEGSGVIGNQVVGNYIGTDATGRFAVGNEIHGIFIGLGARGNLIGGSMRGAGNIISGNQQVGVFLQDEGTTGNQILGNLIGVNAAGMLSLGNGDDGIFIGFGASRNLIGSDKAGTRNLISGNGISGIKIQGEETTENQILGNFIGADISGTMAISNALNGITIISATSNIIGDLSPVAPNLISGNASYGVSIAGSGATSNHIQGNRIGTDLTDLLELGNLKAGIVITDSASSNMIGISNTIVYNHGAGVLIGGNTIGNTITRNAIYGNDGLPIDWVEIPSPIGGSVELQLSEFFTDTRKVIGGGCISCTIEFFGNPNAAPAGTYYLGATRTNDNGAFIFTVPSILPYLAATMTDVDGSTYEFSNSLETPLPVYLPVILFTSDSTITRSRPDQGVLER